MKHIGILFLLIATVWGSPSSQPNVLFGVDLNLEFKAKHWQQQPFVFEKALSTERLNTVLPSDWVDTLGNGVGSDVTVSNSDLKDGEIEQRVIAGIEKYYPEIGHERCKIQSTTGFNVAAAALHFYPPSPQGSTPIAKCHLRDQFIVALDDRLLVQVFDSEVCRTLPVFYGGGEDGGKDIYFFRVPDEHKKEKYEQPIAQYEILAGDVLYIPQYTRFSVVSLLSTRPAGTAASSNAPLPTSTSAKKAPRGVYYSLYMDIGLGSTWEGVFRNTLLSLYYYCEDHEETGWCDRYYLHEDAYPALHLAIREGAQDESLPDVRRTVSFGPTYSRPTPAEVESRCTSGPVSTPFTATLLSPEHPANLEAVEKCLDLAFRMNVVLMKDLGKKIAIRANRVIVENMDYRELRAIGKTYIPMSRDLLSVIEVDLEARQLDDLSHLRNYPMVLERIEEATNFFFAEEFSRDRCVRAIQAGRVNDLERIGFTKVNPFDAASERQSNRSL